MRKGHPVLVESAADMGSSAAYCNLVSGRTFIPFVWRIVLANGAVAGRTPGEKGGLKALTPIAAAAIKRRRFIDSNKLIIHGKCIIEQLNPR